MPSVEEVSARFVDEYAKLDPVRAVRSMGGGAAGTTLTDYSPGGTAELRDFLVRTRDELAGASDSGERERLGRMYLAEQVAGELALIDAGERQRSMSIIGAPPASVRMLFDLTARDSDSDWEAV